MRTPVAARAVLVTTSRLVVRHCSDDPFGAGTSITLEIVKRGTDAAIGSVDLRVEPEESTAEVTHLTIVEPERGRGYGSEVLRALVDDLLDERRFARVVALPRADDEPGQRLLERAGLRAVAADGDTLVYVVRR